MEENTILDKLGLFGLTRQEAAIYLCLYRNGGLSGYEVSKLTGISRSNVYSGLSGLADKGAACLEEGSTSKYIAVSIKEFCENKIRSLNREKESLIQNKMITMIEEAEKRIYFSASLPVIEQLGEEFTKVLDRKIKLVFITDGMPKEDSFMKDAICYIGDARENSVRLIIDSEYALTGELTGKKDDTCLYTGQDNFIRVFKEALRNEMKLIELTEGENKNE